MAELLCGICLGTGTVEEGNRESDCPYCDNGVIEGATDIQATLDLAAEPVAKEGGK